MRRTSVLAFALSAAACAARYATRGLVLGVDRATQTVTVSHDAIDGFMAPMVMPFIVMNPSELDGVEPGDRIGFRLHTAKERTRIDRSGSFRRDCRRCRNEAHRRTCRGSSGPENPFRISL